MYVSRDTEKEVYDFIANECDEIAEVLPAVPDEYGRVTKYTAIALKSRVMLYAASIATFSTQQLDGLLGFPDSEAAAYWQKAYDAAIQIVNSGMFALYNGKEDKALNYQYIFLDEGNTETIFSKVYNGKDNVGHSFDLYNFPAGFNKAWGAKTSVYLETVEAYEYIDGRNGKLDYDSLQTNLINFEELFKDKDPRFFASVLYPGATFQDGKFYAHSGTYINGGYDNSVSIVGEWNNEPWFAKSKNHDQANTLGTCFPIRKFVNEEEEQVFAGESHTDYIVFRYAEVLLNLAEAAFHLGKTEEALMYVNEIRERAGIVPLTTISRDEIRQERRVELAFEGHRFWDLRRWRIAVAELSKEMHEIDLNFDWDSKSYEIIIQKADDVVRSFYEKHYYLPITVGRISNNPNLVPENPGY